MGAPLKLEDSSCNTSDKNDSDEEKMSADSCKMEALEAVIGMDLGNSQEESPSAGGGSFSAGKMADIVGSMFPKVEVEVVEKKTKEHGGEEEKEED